MPSFAVLEFAPIALDVITIVGAEAMFAAVGLTQFDIKRVIAYSTCSQLGYMFLPLAYLPIRRQCFI